MDDPQLTLASNIYDLQSLTQCSEHLTLALVAACFFLLQFNRKHAIQVSLPSVLLRYKFSH